MLSIGWQWLSSIHEPPEIRETGAKLRIALGPEVLTRNVDDWSKTVSDDVRVSAYPLALWFASNWWRLRWEPLPQQGLMTVSWRMSHEFAAAGYGYIWPRVLIASDGEAVQIWSAPTGEHASLPVKYLTGAHGVVPAEEFEHEIDHFLNGVAARLKAVGIEGTALQGLLAELAEERADVQLTAYRTLEAIAGFDAGEGPKNTLATLEELISRAGMNATQELATLCSSGNSGQTLADVVGVAAEDGVAARPIDAATDLAFDNDEARFTPAWVRGKEFALELRRRLGMNGAPIPDDELHEILGVSSREISEAGGQRRAPLGLAVRRNEGTLTLHSRKRHPVSIRFELARFLYDNATAAQADRWLPVTDGKTSRQKAQRAFAAEFLCPIEVLRAYLSDDFSDDAIEDAANHFRVGTPAVQSQLVNNGVLPRGEFLEYFGNDLMSPYRPPSPL